MLKVVSIEKNISTNSILVNNSEVNDLEISDSISQWLDTVDLSNKTTVKSELIFKIVPLLIKITSNDLLEGTIGMIETVTMIPFKEIIIMVQKQKGIAIVTRKENSTVTSTPVFDADGNITDITEDVEVFDNGSVMKFRTIPNLDKIQAEEADRKAKYLELQQIKREEEKEAKKESDLGVDIYTDLGNSERFYKMFKNELKYCYKFKSWLVWTGKKWEVDGNGLVMRHAKTCVMSLYADASDETLGDYKRKKLLEHAKLSQSLSRITAMLSLAQHLFSVNIDEMDTDKNLLNVNNGVLDLRTGELLPHSSSRLITKITNIDYDMDAECPTFIGFINSIFPNKPDLVRYIQCFLGYSLTGICKEQIFGVAWGTGANGKGTLLNCFLRLMGDYGMSTPASTFLAKKTENGGSPNNDIARLRGARFVIASELEQGKRINESLIKRVTGEDPMDARFLHQEYFRFIPEFKLILLTNHKPITNGEDNEAFWRRVQLIPFTEVFTGDKVDFDLPAKLDAEFPGILRWCLEGCLEWQKNGLKPPTEVIEATAGYQTESSTIGQWVDENCVMFPHIKTGGSILYKNYVNWMNDNGNTRGVQKSKLFFEVLENKYNCIRSRANSDRNMMQGIGLIAVTDDEKDGCFEGKFVVVGGAKK